MHFVCFLYCGSRGRWSRFPFASSVSGEAGETPRRRIPCCFFTDSFCLALFVVDWNVRLRWIYWSFSLSFTSCNPTTTITNQFFSDGSKFAVLGQTVRVCYKYIDWLTGFLCPHVELCTFEDHVSLDDEMLIEFLFHFGIVRLVSLRESRTMTMSFASSPTQYIIVFICRGCWVRSICNIAWRIF